MSVALRRKKLNGGRVSLYLDIYWEGIRHYEFLRLYLDDNKANNRETLNLAKAIRAKRELALQTESHGLIPHFKKQASFLAFFESQVNLKVSTNTAWRNTRNHLEKFSSRDIRFSEVTIGWLDSFQTYLLQNVSPSTARLYFATVRSALNKAVRAGFIVSSPADRVDQIKAPESERVFLTLSEVRQFAAAETEYVEIQRAFLFACYSGMRISDIRTLEWGQVRDGRIHFRQKKTKGQEYLPLSSQAIRLLGKDGNPDEKIFLVPSMTSVERQLRIIALVAGIKKHLTFHVSRHTFATLLLTHGEDIYTVSKLLGHRDLKSTQIYGRIIDKKKEEAVERIPEI